MAGAAAGSVAGVVLKRVVDNRIVLMENEDTESGDGSGSGGGSSGGMGPSTLAVISGSANGRGLSTARMYVVPACTITITAFDL